MESVRTNIKSVVKSRVGPFVAARQPTRRDLPLAQWGLEAREEGRLWLRGLDLEDLAREHGTPLYLVDTERLDEAASAAVAPHRAGRGADIFYSYKTNPVPGVLRRLHAAGIGAEVISAYELWLAMQLGVSPDRIIYNGPAKSDASLAVAVRNEVGLINANSVTEARRIAAIARQERSVVNLGIRVSVPGSWGGQFGIASDSPSLTATIRSVLADDSVNLTGLHVHRGGVIRSGDEWQTHLQNVLHLCDDVHRNTDWTPSIIDYGGSLACPTVASVPARSFRLHRALGTDLIPPVVEEAISVAQASQMAHKATREHFDSRGWPSPIVAMEPGRSLTGDTQMLLVSVVDVSSHGPLSHAVLDGGRNIAEPLPHEFHQLFHVSKPSAPHDTSYRLVGPICTPSDVLYYSWRLPVLEVGDVLAVMDAGAYFVPFSTSFSFPRPSIVEYDSEVRELRRREDFTDLVDRDLPADGLEFPRSPSAGQRS